MLSLAMSPTDPLLEALSSWRAARRASVQAVADFLGVHRNTAADWLKGKAIPDRYRQDVLQRLQAPAPGATTVGSPAPAAMREPGAAYGSPVRAIPVLTSAWCSAHPASGWSGQLMPADAADLPPIYVDARDTRRLLGFRAEGDSMIPTILPGAAVIAHMDSTLIDCLRHCCMVVWDARDGTENHACKRLLGIGTKLLFASDNPTYAGQLLEIEPADLRGCWRLIAQQSTL